MKYLVNCLVVIAVLVSASCTEVFKDPTAEEIIAKVTEAKEAGMEKIEDVTIVYDNEITYRKKAELNGKIIYKTRVEVDSEEEKKSVTIWDGEYLRRINPMTGEVIKEEEEYDISDMFNSLRNSKFEYLGKEKLEGKKNYKLDVLDLSKLPIFQGLESFDLHVWIDAKDWVLSKAEVIVSVEDDDRSTLITMEYQDYRNIGGMLIAFKTIKTISPLIGGMIQETEVLDVKINQGLSDDLFEWKTAQ